jgi:ferrous iron transport protein A
LRRSAPVAREFAPLQKGGNVPFSRRLFAQPSPAIALDDDHALYDNRNHSYLVPNLMAAAATTLTLNRLHPGESGTILALEASEELYQRLVALGLCAGKKVRLLRRARFGGPLHVRVGTTELMIRTREARCICLQHGRSANP